jgi:hypothetical protein
MLTAIWRVLVLGVFTVSAAFASVRAQTLELLEKHSEAELIQKMRAKIGSEKVAGIWVDTRHMCGLVAIVGVANRLRHITMCSDGSTSMSEFSLEVFRASVGARRAWRTPGLTRRRVIVLGSRTVEYVDRKGDRHDLFTYVEKQDGLLYAYQDGVGIDEMRDKPWMVGKKVE